MKQKVAITGVSQTKTKFKRRDVNFPELMGEAVELALEDAEVTAEDIDCVIVGSAPEFFEGINEPENWCSDNTLGVLKPHYRVHTGGTVGGSVGICAYYQIRSGLFDTVLAVSGDKLSESSVQQGLSLVYSPILGRDFAAGAPSAVANQTRIYMEQFPHVKEEHLAKIGTKSRKNALNNPYAALKLPQITEEMMLNMNWLSTPFRLLDSCPTSDAACAMVLQGEKIADSLNKPVAWIQAVSTIAEGVNYPDRDWSNPLALYEAARNIYKECGIEDPLEQLDLVELYAAFTNQEIIWAEGLGLAKRGEGHRLIDEGITSIDGELPINPSGGVLSNNSIGASALIRQAEVALQIMEKAGDRQIKDVNVGIAHGWGGALQFHVLMLLSKHKDLMLRAPKGKSPGSKKHE